MHETISLKSDAKGACLLNILIQRSSISPHILSMTSSPLITSFAKSISCLRRELIDFSIADSTVDAIILISVSNLSSS